MPTPEGILDEEERRKLLEYFLSKRVSPDRARSLVNELTFFNFGEWLQQWQDAGADDNKIDELMERYLSNWVEVARSEQFQDAMAMFLASPNVQEQMRREDVVRAVQRRYGSSDPEILQMLSEQQAITTTEQIRQRQLSAQEQQWQERVAAMEQPKTPVGAAATFVTKAREISPAFSRFAEQELPTIYQELGMTEARRRWLEERARFEPEPKGAGEIFLTGTTQEIADAEQPHIEYEERQARKRRKDPWEELLASPSFLLGLEERFKGLAPEERGFFSGKFRPRARFLG